MPIPHTSYLVEVIFRPSILDNIGCWQVFENERHMFNFLNCINELSFHLVDGVQEGDSLPLVQLQTNMIPKGLVPLERIFDKSDVLEGINKSKLDV